MVLTQILNNIEQGETAVRHALFSVISILTGTGYATTDYGQWGGFAVSAFFIITFIGGCAGSTSCGIKIFRFQVLFLDLKQHIREILYPSGVFVKRYNGAILTDDVSASVMSFIFLYIAALWHSRWPLASPDLIASLPFPAPPQRSPTLAPALATLSVHRAISQRCQTSRNGCYPPA